MAFHIQFKNPNWTMISILKTKLFAYTRKCSRYKTYFNGCERRVYLFYKNSSIVKRIDAVAALERIWSRSGRAGAELHDVKLFRFEFLYCLIQAGESDIKWLSEDGASHQGRSAWPFHVHSMSAVNINRGEVACLCWSAMDSKILCCL